MENLYSRVVAFGGVLLMIAISVGVSTNRKASLKRWDLMIWGMALQFIFAIIVLKTEWGRTFFSWFNDAFQELINVTNKGSEFVFGSLMGGSPDGSDVATTSYVDAAVARAIDPSKPAPMSNYFSIAIGVLPTIIFFSALCSILYHLGILQFIVKWIAWVMQRTLKTSGAETLSAAANIFVGQTEAPLVIKPFMARLTNSEMMTVMTAGFAGVAGGVMAFYVIILGKSIPGVAGHLLAGSVMSAPAALMFGKLMVPEEEKPETADSVNIDVPKESDSVFDAITLGTTDGLHLALNVAAMLISFIAMIALVDLLLGGIAGMFMPKDQIPAWLSLRGIAGILFTPFAYMLGITDWQEAIRVGQLMSVKMMANEFVAYLDLARISEAGELSERTRVIAAYALCGFANFGSIGIQIGGLSVMAPNRRKDLSRLAFRAMIAGTFASNATGCVAAILL